jgi:hypothetical protein
MIKVYFETTTSAYLVAIFESEEMYFACLPILEKRAEKEGYFVTESLEEGVMSDLN